MGSVWLITTSTVYKFDYLKARHIANARKAIRFDLGNLGRELPELLQAGRRDVCPK